MTFQLKQKRRNPILERKIHVPHNHLIRISLDLKDNDIIFNHSFCKEMIVKEILSKIYCGSLTYQIKACPCCGVKNENYSIVKNVFFDDSN